MDYPEKNTCVNFLIICIYNKVSYHINKTRGALCNLVANKHIRENIRAPCLAMSPRLHVTLKLFLTSYSPSPTLGDFHR